MTAPALSPNPILLIVVLITSHLIAMWVGSSSQVRAQRANSHAHLSNVGDAITLGEYFLQTESDAEGHPLAARATAAIIYRILNASSPGPNSEARLNELQHKLFLKYPRDYDDDGKRDD